MYYYKKGYILFHKINFTCCDLPGVAAPFFGAAVPDDIFKLMLILWNI